MSDRELLELAAKAAGIETFRTSAGNLVTDNNGKSWNPLTDDGDALRLAVKLGMLVDIRLSPSANQRGRTLIAPDRLSSKVYFEDHGDPSIATRRAIVRAAAIIGEKTCRT